VRWWNVRHPRTYSAALLESSSPAQAREVLETSDRRVERVMLDGTQWHKITFYGDDTVPQQ